MHAVINWHVVNYCVKKDCIHPEFLPGKRNERLGNLGENIKISPIKK
ncbi:transposase (plasmid) [Piscirickettsia salmonis]|uniref:Transposase n=1 Tax=Piscirickettsia salmonis TaxID=1238 RepID=A0AAC8VKW2_PISSA|nr:transposase [Piscirickettsia salmonis]